MQTLQTTQLHIVAQQVMDLNNGTLILVSYGSLPTKPEAGMGPMSPALVLDHDKDLCVAVTSCRGRTNSPGLVAGLLPAVGSRALAMIGSVDVSALPALCARELNGKAYDPRILTVSYLSGQRVFALGFVAAITHPDCRQYDIGYVANVVATAFGDCGTNLAYLDMTLDFERRAFGYTTPRLERIKAAIQNRSRRFRPTPPSCKGGVCYPIH